MQQSIYKTGCYLLLIKIKFQKQKRQLKLYRVPQLKALHTPKKTIRTQDHENEKHRSQRPDKKSRGGSGAR